ncbi:MULTISPECIES: acyltransferase family protein [Streptomyces]|uniref:Fucose 4-O-acetylase n=1 Tax=Streptomyces chartreusis NRRL 3882 TaxID=1079985 RepID=A0A2N9BLF2_STRCX|nr:acyltransferase [Streptomyces chartreusis]MYS88578.1 acyltransferase family protein [Streptomyces sp. SID5464]SOR84196.1 Fucose 4-O-acetylase [Streptomyces chartreusis NRRL 3882]
MSRDRYVDFLRAWAIALVVVGHWLITVLVRGPGGEITAPELLAVLPWTQWLTLGFQIMPLFFLAGGHAASGSWARTRAAGGTASGWVARRASRLLLPAGVYSALVLLAVGVCAAVRVDPGTLELVGWAMAMQFWFLPVYLLLSALTPPLHAAHRRWGLGVPVVLGAAALAADALAVAVHVPYVGLLNYVLVWGIAYQLGFCWRDGLLTGHRATAPAMAACGGVAFAALVGVGPFPVSLIRVTGQSPGNTDPPSAAMLAWVVAQVGLCLLAARAMRRLLDRERVWRVVSPVGGASMTLYLWHMLPVLVVAAAFYLTGLAPQPAFGSAAWWALRVPWLLVLGVVLAGVVAVLRPLERGLAAVHERIHRDADLHHPWPLWLGLATAVAALTRFAGQGFAPGGRLPLPPALGLALGALLVVLSRRTKPRDAEKPDDVLEEAA